MPLVFLGWFGKITWLLSFYQDTEMHLCSPELFASAAHRTIQSFLIEKLPLQMKSQWLISYLRVETFYPLAYTLRTDCGSNFVLSPWCDSTITSYQCVTIWKENALFLAVKQKGMVWVALVLTFAMPSLFFWGLLHIAIAVAALFPKCQTSSCENISLESKRIYFSDLCSLSIFIPVISPIDCSFWFLQCFVQFLLHLGKIFILRMIL